MNTHENYLKINRLSWNNKVAVHAESDFYDIKGFLRGNTSLNPIELGLLGNIKGKKILHLQCHFGLDSLSLGRLGAKVTGVDLSDMAIKKAKELAAKIESDTRFICCDVYDLPNHLDEKFDIVFTSYGTIGWLPDMKMWANVINHFLKPQGKFVFVEFHPVVWMFDNHFNKIKYNYFNKGAIIETIEGTYAEKDASLSQKYVMWNHSLGDVLSSLLQNDIQIIHFDEYDYSPYDCFEETVLASPGKYRIKHLSDYIPMVYALVGIKNTA